MKIAFFGALLFAIITGCSDKKIEITCEYIINANWNKKNEGALANSITINKMKVRKDSSINPFSYLSQSELLSKLEEDTSFMHYANVKIKEGESYKNTKVYFNQDNGFYWGSKSRFNSSDTLKTIGRLDKRSWYRFSDLGLIVHPSYIFVYVDSLNEVHRFDVNLANY